MTLKGCLKLFVAVVVIIVAILADRAGPGGSLGGNVGGQLLKGVRAVLSVTFSADFIEFERRHRELYAEAEKDGEYAKVTMHYYSLQADVLQAGIGHYWHWVPENLKLSIDENFGNFNQMVAEELGLKSGQTLCEVGCGLYRTGRDVAARSAGGEGVKFVGLTLSPREVEIGQAELAEEGMSDRAKIIMGDYTNMPLEDGVCDAVFAIYTLKYSYRGDKLPKALSEISRVLKPGGRFGSYEILTTDTFDEKNKTQADWVYHISYNTGMPPLSGLKDFRELPPKHGLNIVKEVDLEKADGVVPSGQSYPHRMFYPCDTVANILSWIEWLGIKKGLNLYVDNFLRHPLHDLVESQNEGVVTGSTLFVYEKGASGWR